MKTLDDLRKTKEQTLETIKARDGAKCRVVVSMGTCGIAAGAGEVLSAIQDEVSKRKLTDVIITKTGCRGLCEREPIIDVCKPGQPAITYGCLTPENARTIVAQHLVNDSIVADLVIKTK